MLLGCAGLNWMGGNPLQRGLQLQKPKGHREVISNMFENLQHLVGGLEHVATDLNGNDTGRPCINNPSMNGEGKV